MTKLLQIARPQFLLSGLALFVFGAAWAVLLGAHFSLPRAILGYLVLMPAHLSISYSNDYFDVEVDKHDKPTLFSGGGGILADHPGLRRPALSMAIGLIALSLILGIVFQQTYAFPVWFLGLVVLGNLVGWFYTAPPVRLAYRGLGEIAMMATVGLLIPGLGYLVSGGQIHPDGFLFAAPLMLYGLAFILAVEIPDMESDRLGGKRTWVARRGRGFAFATIAAALLLATLYFFCLPWLMSRIPPLDLRILGALSILPLGAGCIGAIKRPADRRPATRMVNGIMIALAAFCILADGYLIYLAL